MIASKCSPKLTCDRVTILCSDRAMEEAEELELGEIETISDPGHGSDELVSKPNTTTPVWKHFGFESDAAGKPVNVDRPLCRVYRQDVGAKEGNTSNLYSHLKNKHLQLYNEVMKVMPRTGKPKCAANQPSVAEAFQRVQSLSTTSREQAELTRAVTHCLAKDMLPIHTVEKKGFKTMLQHFYPQYQLPSRNYFTRVVIPTMVGQVRSEIE